MHGVFSFLQVDRWSPCQAQRAELQLGESGGLALEEEADASWVWDNEDLIVLEALFMRELGLTAGQKW